jgi:ubiquinone/menaquinone biosynthesis C-methylase UbiE
MALMHSVDAANVWKKKRGRAKWIRTMRRASPPESLDQYLQHWEAFFDHYAAQVDYWQHRNAGYHKAIAVLARFYVSADARVLEIGSGNGDLLAALQPSFGVGVDISGQMVRLAAMKYPHLHFRQIPAEHLNLSGEPFDFIVLSDLVGYLYDIRLVFEQLRKVSHPRTRVVMHWYSRLWQPLLGLAETLGLKYPQPLLNWTTVEDMQNLLYLAGFEVVHSRPHILWPKQVPLLTTRANRYLAHVPGLR